MEVAHAASARADKRTVQHPRCPAFIELTNSGTVGTSGRLEAWADGVLVQTFSVVAAPGSTQHLTAYANNPFFSQLIDSVSAREVCATRFRGTAPGCRSRNGWRREVTG